MQQLLDQTVLCRVVKRHGARGLMMRKALFILVLCTWQTSCTVGDLDVAGKSCSQNHPCPDGYACTLVFPFMEETCSKTATGQDGGPGVCITDETRCVEDDIHVKEVCVDGLWHREDCIDEEDYCLDATGECENPCLETEMDCPDEHWCNPTNWHCEPRGDCSPYNQVKCRDLTLDAVLVCDEDSGLWRVMDECNPSTEFCDPLDPLCKSTCQSDTDCTDWPNTPTCDLSQSRCVSVGLCASDTDCEGATNLCVEPAAGACVMEPSELVSTSSGTPEMGCYVIPAIPPPATPTTCTLTGEVQHLFGPTPDGVLEDLEVNLMPLDLVLAGTPAPGDNSDLLGSDHGFSFSDVETNKDWVILVSGTNSAGQDYADFFNFGFYLRADDCSEGGGSVHLTAYALPANLYPSYADPAGSDSIDPLKGILVAKVVDCGLTSDPLKIIGVTGGLSMPHDRFYYLEADNIPNLDLEATTAKGIFGAANVSPIRGLVSALAKTDTIILSLGAKHVRVFPSSASLVIFDRPRKPDSTRH